MNTSSAQKIIVPLAIGAVVVICLLAIAVGFLISNQLSAQNEKATLEAFSTALQATSEAGAAAATAGAQATGTARASLPTSPPFAAATPAPTFTPDPAIAAATEQALAQYRAALANYGVDPQQGTLAYVFQPVTISLDHYLAAEYSQDFLALPLHNFVVEANVTWETRTGLAGCGFIFRADANNNYYGMGIARGAEGVAIFAKGLNGEFAEDFRTEGAPATNWQNGDTNKLAVVAENDRFRLFVNDQLQMVTSDSQLTEGIVALAALSEYGETICTYSNGWLWALD